jgi:anti-sigma factor RsiW
MDCDRLLAALPRYLDDALDSAERDAVRRHLAECASCRRRAVVLEPSLALVAARPRDPSPDEVERCVGAVTSLIRQQRLASRLHRPRRRLLAAAAVLIIALAAGTAWRLSGGGPATTAPTGIGTAAVETPVRPAPEVEVDMREAGVRVYHLAIDDAPNTVVALVVNPALEL